MPDGFDSLFLHQRVRGREAMHLTLNQREQSQPRFESGRTHQFRKRNSMAETSPFKRRDVSSTLTASTTQLSSKGSGRGASNSGMQVRFLLAAPCFQAMACSTSWPSPLSFKQKITGLNPVHVTTRRDLSKVGTMFLTHEIEVQLPNSPSRHQAARGRAHTGTRFLNGITQVGFLPG
jgi:hypothetical protein